MVRGRGNQGGGRRSKGDRIFVGVRVPAAHALEIHARAEADGISVTDYVARVLAEHLATAPPIETRQELEMTA